jgi:hypothetical protein
LETWTWIILPIANPWLPILAGAAYFLLYLVLTFFFYAANRQEPAGGLLARNGLLDITSSIVLVSITAWLIVNVIVLGARGSLTFQFLVAYYGLFIFLFAGIYSLLEWHFPGSLQEVSKGTWETELQCLILSLQTMTTLGPTRATPKRYLAELVACAEAILGIFFIGVFVARWVNTLT